METRVQSPPKWLPAPPTTPTPPPCNPGPTPAGAPRATSWLSRHAGSQPPAEPSGPTADQGHGRAGPAPHPHTLPGRGAPRAHGRRTSTPSTLFPPIHPRLQKPGDPCAPRLPPQTPFSPGTPCQPHGQRLCPAPEDPCPPGRPVPHAVDALPAQSPRTTSPVRRARRA